MNATELVTSEWLGSKGYYVMPSVKFGRKEADILAIRPGEEQPGLLPLRLHVEVSVSSRPWGSRRSPEEYEKDASDYFKKKFEALDADVRKLLGGDYQRWLVLGKLAGGQQEEETWKSTMLLNDVMVKTFDEIVKDYVNSFRSRPVGLTGELLDVLNALGLLKG
jgi:hypothetical protein